MSLTILLAFDRNNELDLRESRHAEGLIDTGQADCCC
jgi:hypothetical protein